MNKHEQNQKNFLTDKLNEYTDTRKAKVLEIGIGTGRIGRKIADKVREYKGIDPIEEKVEKARENKPKEAKVEYKQGNAVDVPFEEQFDVILYINSWHYIKDHDQAISEAKRLLSSDGVVIITEPTEYTTNWDAPQLKKDSEEFDKEIYNQKMKNIKDSEENLRNQKVFDIKEEGFLGKKNNKFYILK
ncbi:MAG: class I SAM-dependent methyltransferase [Candidatus Magasanikbacteria bacterium]